MSAEKGKGMQVGDTIRIGDRLASVWEITTEQAGGDIVYTIKIQTVGPRDSVNNVHWERVGPEDGSVRAVPADRNAVPSFHPNALGSIIGESGLTPAQSTLLESMANREPPLTDEQVTAEIKELRDSLAWYEGMQEAARLVADGEEPPPVKTGKRMLDLGDKDEA